MTNWRWRRLHPGDFWRSVLAVSTGTMFGQVIGVVTLPILSRLYAPEDFGEYAVVMSVSALLTTLATLGLAAAIMAPDDNDDAEKVVIVTFGCALVITTVLVAVALLLGSFFQISWIPVWQLCLLAYLMTVINTVVALLRVYTNRRGYNRALAINAIVAALCTLLISIPIGFVAPSSLGLIIASLAAATVGSLQMLWRANPFRHRPTRHMVTTVLREYRSFIAFQYPANLLETASTQLPMQLLSRTYGSAQLGSYAMNERLLGAPLRLVGTPISTIYFRRIFQLVRAGHSGAALTFSIVSKVQIAAWAPMAVIIVKGPDLFAWALGDQWRTAGVLCTYLAPLYVLTLCRASVSYGRVAIGRQRSNAVLAVARLALVVGSLLFGHRVFGSIEGTIAAFSIGSSIFMIIDMAVTFALMRSHLGRHLMMMSAYALSVAILWILAGTFPIG